MIELGCTVQIKDIQHFIQKWAKKPITNQKYRNNVLLNCAGKGATVVEDEGNGCYRLMILKGKRQIVQFQREDFDTHDK